jgi:hypothetical protein
MAEMVVIPDLNFSNTDKQNDKIWVDILSFISRFATSVEWTGLSTKM